MNKNEMNPKDNEKSSLSDMINEYDSDNALRAKIEAIKKQKAMEEEARKQAEIQHRLDEIEASKKQKAQSVETPQQPIKQPEVKQPIVKEDTTQVPPTTNNQPFMDADADITQVFTGAPVTLDEDGDKTLVIMDNKKQRNFNANTEKAPVKAPIKKEAPERLAPEFEVNDEEITEQDIEEYLPEDNKSTKKSKKGKDPDKMNKIITYVIAGIAGLCVIGLVIFGLNILGVFGGSKGTLELDEVTVDEKTNMEEIGANNFTLKGSEVEKITDTALITKAKAEAKSTEDGTKVQVDSVDKSALKAEKGSYKVSFSTKKGTKVTVKATVSESAKTEEEKKPEEEEENAKDNSAKINELEGQIRINNDQIERLQTENGSLQNTIDTAPEAVAKIDNNYVERIDAANREYSTKEAAQATAQKAYDNAKGTPQEKDAQAALTKAQGEYEAANQALADLNSEISQAKEAIQSDVSNATAQIETNNQTIMDLQNEIIDLQNQLSAL